ncbi:MAG: hypothetical protein JXQ82_04295 [Methanomicrobiaceae archaeon]|nr:hypothetical protein [Methanomicrobiaceae archaeon]
MNPKELMNFSIYDFDLFKFGGSWDNVRNLIDFLDLDGLELLVNFDPVPDTIPRDIVKAVHLPSFMGWVRVWDDEKFMVPEEIADESVKYFYGGRSRDQIVSNFCECLTNASSLNPAYGVFHATYTEVDSAFSTEQLYSDREILSATAGFLNEAASYFPEGEPPFPIYIENLWYPGLTFLNSDNILEFMDLLEFKRWKFLLDTGHLMNATKDCNDEEKSIDKVIECLEKLDSDIIKNTDGIHLQLSTSGDYQKTATEPGCYSEISFDEKFIHIMGHLKKVDEHRSFSSEKCRDIVEFVSPSFITHELQAKTAAEIESMFSLQISVYRKNGLKKNENI